ncbi:DUF4433 domain-containing protein [Porphyrobacter sp. TH134]|uniref:type II toxin-antitoxin system toxin DNA ADP-ribosyl transferase DarT n=1 Tax=Porphyrobacter sp. TH134 TaxID=2067450 RepID=UPI000C7AD966|nr:DUF4433 domain-containing protein [Porphyrobacter sp. TH134]PLK22450.1 DUF4433 domain-containing protein [Porphyrobacter sp. TH134]
MNLGPDKAHIFRIVHRDNLPWILHNGIHCRSSELVDPNYVDIGNPDLIDRRSGKAVPVEPGGTLSDYVPFYFTPRSPMLLNIKTGYGGIRQRANEEILILVSSLYKVRDYPLPFLFTDRHAYVQTAIFHNDLSQLPVIDWEILCRSDFKRDNNDLGKFERYQAEALVQRRVPVAALLGIACSSEAAAGQVHAQLAAADVALEVAVTPGWYF